MEPCRDATKPVKYRLNGDPKREFCEQDFQECFLLHAPKPGQVISWTIEVIHPE